MMPITTSTDDCAQRFLIENQEIRGVIVHLTQSFRTILEKHDYPIEIQQYLGEIVLAAALLMETVKLDGRLTIQFQSESALKMLVAQINNEGHLRALAQWEKTADAAWLQCGFDQGQLVMTIFDNHHEKPMQSIVALEHRSIADALAHYFVQSEQLPTLFSFAVKEAMASGMLLQKLPDTKNNPENAMRAWDRVVKKFTSIDPRELLFDNNISFLQHYFPKDDIRVFDIKKLAFQCGCTVEKMENAISVLGEAEAKSILKEKAEIVVTCEYCLHEYAFDREKVEKIFRKH